MNYPKISVIVASNRDRSLYEESLKGHDYPNYEIIPVSGYTAAKARNIGLKKASGEIVAFIDDDVIVPRGWLANGVKLLKENDADIVGGPNIIPAKSSLGEKISDFLISTSILNGFRKKFKKHYCEGFSNYRNFATCNVVMRKEVFDKVGYFNESYKYTEDMEFFLRCDIEEVSFYYSPEFFLHHKRRSFPFAHMRQVFFWGYGNMQMAIDYPFVFKRADIWGSFILWPGFLTALYFYFKPTIILSMILLPLLVHFLSYSLGVITRGAIYIYRKAKW